MLELWPERTASLLIEVALRLHEVLFACGKFMLDLLYLV